ncbi:MAG: mechanosensitive ion channel, partial [Desulfobacterales bacterium]|nr:mechanosensitive ion channel [Desulfobacterales bacterium]
AYKGVTGYIYFDEEGDAQKSVPVGVFKNNRLISAPVQLSPVKDFKEIGSAGVSGMADGLVYGPGEGREKKDDDVLFINGMHLRKTNYVYTGIEVNEINALDADNLLFDMDFYLWLRFQEGVEPWRIEFVNATEPIELKEHIAEEKSGRIIYRKYHVKGRFRADFLSRPPKFGQHILGVGFRHQHLTRDKMVYIVDELGMGMTGDARSKKGSNRFLGAASGWAVSRVNFFQDIQEKNSMGDPRYLSARHGKINYSRFNLEIAIKKIQVTLRGVVKSLPANYALCLTSALIILLAAVCGRNEKYEDSMKLVVLARMVCTGVFFLGAETLLLDALTGKTGVYNLERIQLAFDILWWLAPAYFLNLGFRQFIIYPLEKRTERKVPSLLIYFIKFIVYILAFFGIIAFVFDQRLTSLLATSGVLAMIIGLAVQINISNIFSGIAINLERPFRVGDSVKIGSEQGKVVDITWRTTRISTIMGNIISIPNSNASETVVVNYSYPDDTHWHGFDLNLDHTLDPDHIIAILEEAVVSVEGVLAPAVTFNGFTEWSANYLVYFQIRDYSQRNAFIELVWKSVWKQLKSEGIKPAIKHHKLVQEIRVDGDSKIPALPVAS